MDTKRRIHLAGQLPDRWRQALDELGDDLRLVPAWSGLEITCRRGKGLGVVCDGEAATITWAEPVQFYRALSLLPLPPAPCEIREMPRFRDVGVMFDCSRNGVLAPETAKFFLRKMALMGLDLAMLYTEDTYTVPEQPFFGYKRGRYTFDELKALDDYAAMLGIELCPCIQTLGHLGRVLHWPAFEQVRDNSQVLLADREETYELLDQMIRAASAPFRSRRIHIGMDEAYGVGLGEHLAQFGWEDPRAVMGRHLARVLDITDKYGLQPMMWSDMYFHLDGGGYHSPDMPSEKAIKAVDPRVTLVYWDYYHDKEAAYAGALKKHRAFPVPTAFAGGLWTWAGLAPAYEHAMKNSAAGLKASMKAGVDTVLATAWGDNGAEISLLTALPGMQLYAEMTYTGVYDPAALAARFRRCCGGDIRAFYDLSLLNALPGASFRPEEPMDLAKLMLYEDPLVELFEADTADLPLAEHFASLVPLYARRGRENPVYWALFDHYAALAHTLSLKCALHASAAAAVRGKDRERAAALAGDIPALQGAVDTLRHTWRRLWESTNKPNGFEAIDQRLGAVAARLSTAGEKMRAFADGRTDSIPELEEPGLICRRRPDGSVRFVNAMAEITTPAAVDW